MSGPGIHGRGVVERPLDFFTEDNLKLGRIVIADSGNPVEATRADWRKVTQRAGKRWIEFEMVGSDQAERRRRVESRIADIAGHQLPTWQQVWARESEPWKVTSS